MREDLPVVKVTPGEFAMVKLHDRGEPEKSSSTEDITAEDGTISFDQASIGDAVVDGTVECLQSKNRHRRADARAVRHRHHRATYSDTAIDRSLAAVSGGV